jgi:hypothetical protein
MKRWAEAVESELAEGHNVSRIPRMKERSCLPVEITAIFSGARCRWLPNHLRVSASEAFRLPQDNAQ